MSITTKSGIIHYDKVLTNYAVDYSPQQYKFINDLVLPAVVVNKQTDLFRKYSITGKRDVKNSLRAKGVPSNKVDMFAFTHDTYTCPEYALHEEIYPQDLANSDILDEEKHKVYNIMEALLLQKEKNCSDLVFDEANYAGGSKVNISDANDRWDKDDYTTNDPREMIFEYKRTVSRRLGIEPNTLVINDETYDGLCRSAFLASWLGTTKDKNVDLADLAKFFKVARVIVGSSVYNSAKEGQTSNLATIWGKHALLAYINPSTRMDDASFGKTFVWNGADNPTTASRGTVGVRKWYDEDRKIYKIETEMNYVQKLVFQDAAFFIQNVIS